MKPGFLRCVATVLLVAFPALSCQTLADTTRDNPKAVLGQPRRRRGRRRHRGDRRRQRRLDRGRGARRRAARRGDRTSPRQQGQADGRRGRGARVREQPHGVSPPRGRTPTPATRARSRRPRRIRERAASTAASTGRTWSSAARSSRPTARLAASPTEAGRSRADGSKEFIHAPHLPTLRRAPRPRGGAGFREGARAAARSPRRVRRDRWERRRPHRPRGVPRPHGGDLLPRRSCKTAT